MTLYARSEGTAMLEVISDHQVTFLRTGEQYLPTARKEKSQGLLTYNECADDEF